MNWINSVQRFSLKNNVPLKKGPDGKELLNQIVVEWVLPLLSTPNPKMQ
jgi:hypothetical protein